MKPVSLTRHPLKTQPYNKLRFESRNHDGIALYSVLGCTAPPAKAYVALGRAFERHGGRCFYCGERFSPQPLQAGGVHRDHVLPKSEGGENVLHNLVIACGKCGRLKGRDDVHDFRPKAAKAWLKALEKHIRLSLEGSEA